MEQNKGFWYADWSFPIFVGLLSSGVFAGTHMYYLYGIGAFNEVAFVAMLKAGIDTGVYGAVAAFGSAVVVYYNTAETVSVIDCIFESCSAFGTVGLSVGVTGQLNTGAKLLYMACMFMGRVGPVSLAISLTAKPDDNKRKVLPVGHINVG